jgi:ferredoxin-NADP reductase
MSRTAAPPALLSALRSREKAAHGTMAFRFEKPSGWVFKAGQFLDMTLVDPPETDAEGNTRSFSIASGPHEDTLMIATRMRDTAFKRVLKSIPLGTAVKIDGPSGDLTLHRDATRPAVFLAGGIGITPFRSILVQAAREKLPHRLFLFYSNHGPEDAPFLDELEGLEQQNPRFTMIASMSDMSQSSRPWSGETGTIDRAMLSRYLKDAVSPVYYVAGPPKLVIAMRAMLKTQSVADADIRVEEFTGY